MLMAQYLVRLSSCECLGCFFLKLFYFFGGCLPWGRRYGFSWANGRGEGALHLTARVVLKRTMWMYVDVVLFVGIFFFFFR